MVVILHSGQTGVERGAHRGAVATSMPIAGFMALDKRDELGPVPEEIAKHLTACSARGQRTAVRANVAMASGVLVVVPDRRRVDTFTAMRAVMTAARAAGARSLVCDPTTDPEDVARWAHELPETAGAVRILVTGPRGTRWQDGEGIARRLVMAIAVI